MAEQDELRASRIASLGVGKYFFRFQIQKAHAHGAISKYPFQVATPSAPAKIFLGIQSNHGMSTFPNALAPRVPAISHAISERPHTIQFVKLPAGSCNSGGGSIGIVINAHGYNFISDTNTRRQDRLQLKSLHLLQVGRIFHHPSANYSGEAQADGIDIFQLNVFAAL